MRKIHHCLWILNICLWIASSAMAREEAPFELIKKLLPENPVVIEAGAQFGEDTIIMSRLWPQGKIYAFEPSPESYQILVADTATQSNVFSFPLALSDRNGELFFYLAGGASSLKRPAKTFNDLYFHSDLDHPIVVQAITLDDWANAHSVPKIDFIWFDMEGNELSAFKGALQHLPQVKLIYTEVNFQKFWEGGVLYPELKEWLAGHGFREIWQESVPDWHGNVLFINENL